METKGLVEKAAVLDAVDAVRRRYAPPAGAAGASYSAAVQACNEIGAAVLALKDAPPAVNEGQR